ncbi:hypothetical protein PHMEG_0007927 [Phytophthora megakarya]|uniref:Uncharacterized protein n=1 Tax=Phytophthora megakarya TaxID=4795 RepID=A0A225WKG1_9STRA|nr:hypothetical protein PHMEG_0007927 [Phytophthora megakarya]
MAVLDMVYARNENEYENVEHHADTITDEVHPFEIYFMTNWDACKGRWVTCFRQGCPHLGINTNNRLESGWGKLRPDRKMYMSLDASMSTVITLQLIKEKRIFQTNRGKHDVYMLYG